MESLPINDVTAKELTSDLRQQLRIGAKMERQAERMSLHVDKVYKSKVKCLKDLKDKCNQINEIVTAKELNRKATLLNRSDEYVKFVNIASTVRQLRTTKKGLMKEQQRQLEEYGKALSAIDAKFVEMANATDDSIEQAMKSFKSEIAEVEEKIAQLKRKSVGVRPDYGQATDVLLKTVELHRKDISEKYQQAVEESEELMKKLGE